MAQPAGVLGRTALNRALLARQMLLRRQGRSVRAAIEHLVGLQAQAPDQPYVALWSRLEGFRPERLASLVATRRAVRLSLMRNTIHLVTAGDVHSLKPLFQPLHERGLYRGSPWGKGLTPAKLEPVLEEGRRLMQERPLSVAELARLLEQRFPTMDGKSLAYCVRYLVPLVFTTPRGIWRQGGLVRLTTVEAWLGRTSAPPANPERLVSRYLAAFGPASPADFRAWSGLAMGELFERLRPKLRTFQREGGGELFDLPRAPRPAPDTPAPPRFLPDYDNVLLGHSDRTRIIDRADHLGLFSPAGIMKGTVLLDGFVRATWIPTRARGATRLDITPLRTPIPIPDRGPVAEEGMRLLGLLAPGDRHDVRVGAVKA